MVNAASPANSVRSYPGSIPVYPVHGPKARVNLAAVAVGPATWRARWPHTRPAASAAAESAFRRGSLAIVAKTKKNHANRRKGQAADPVNPPNRRI